MERCVTLKLDGAERGPWRSFVRMLDMFMMLISLAGSRTRLCLVLNLNADSGFGLC
jgi:hypothetical protein